MPRPPLVIGTWGRINRVQRSKHVWVAYARFRDHDGATRQLERTGTSAQKAEDLLKAALLERLQLTGDDITSETTIAAVGAVWFADEIDGRRATNTVTWYRHALDDIIEPGVGKVRLREVTVARLDRFLKTVASTRGPGAAKTTKTVLSGILAHAARHDAIDHNPLRDVAPIKRAPKTDVRVLDLQQLQDLRVALYADELAMNRDLPEPIDFMLATGIRIGELLAVRWFDLDLNDEKATVVIRATVVNGAIQEHPKSASSRRRLTLPSWVVTTLRARQAVQLANPFDLVFPSDRNTVRDPSNVRKQWRQFRAEHGYDWVTPHTFRKSVATLAGLELGSQQLGHASTEITRLHYIPKTHEGPDIRSVLDSIGEPANTQRFQRSAQGTGGQRRAIASPEKAS